MGDPIKSLDDLDAQFGVTNPLPAETAGNAPPGPLVELDALDDKFGVSTAYSEDVDDRATMAEFPGASSMTPEERETERMARLEKLKGDQSLSGSLARAGQRFLPSLKSGVGEAMAFAGDALSTPRPPGGADPEEYRRRYEQRRLQDPLLRGMHAGGKALAEAGREMSSAERPFLEASKAAAPKEFFDPKTGQERKIRVNLEALSGAARDDSGTFLADQITVGGGSAPVLIENADLLSDPRWWAENVIDVAASSAPALAVGAFNPIAGAVIGGLMEAGNLNAQLQKDGVKTDEAVQYAAAYGLVASALEKIGLDAVFGQGALAKAGKDWAKSRALGETVKHAAKEGAKGFVGEGGTEQLQDVFQSVFEGLAKGEGMDKIGRRVADGLTTLNTFFAAGPGGGLISGARGVHEAAKEYSTGSSKTTAQPEPAEGVAPQADPGQPAGERVAPPSGTGGAPETGRAENTPPPAPASPVKDLDALDKEFGIPAPAAEAPADRQPQASPPAGQPAHQLGAIVMGHESRGDAGAIGKNAGDIGGPSYGSFQLATNTGTLQRFLDSSPYGARFSGLTPGSAQFDAMWKELAKGDPGFAAAQRDFILATHYEPVRQHLVKAYGLDPDANAGLAEAVLALGNGHGEAGARRVLDRVLADNPGLAPEQLVARIYDERMKRDDTGALSYYKSSSPGIQKSVANRLAEEKEQVLALTRGESPASRPALAARVTAPAGTARAGLDGAGRYAERPSTEDAGVVELDAGGRMATVDAFLGPKPESDAVFVVNQQAPDGSFAGSVAMLGYPSAEAARAAYAGNAPEGVSMSGMVATSRGGLRQWLATGDLDKPAPAGVMAGKGEAHAQEDRSETARRVAQAAELGRNPGQAGPDRLGQPGGSGPVVGGTGPGRGAGSGVQDGRRAAGHAVEIETSSGRDAGRYELREAGSLVPSHDVSKNFLKHPSYPPDVQERPYHSDQGEQLKVKSNAAGLNPNFLLTDNPNFLLTDNPDVINGPPVVTPDGVVLGGNSRAMSIQLAYADHPERGQAYKAALAAKAKSFGLRPEDVEAFDRPVLVRALAAAPDQPEMARKARLYNQTLMQGLDATAEGVSRARLLSPGTLNLAAAQMDRHGTLREYLSKPESRALIAALTGDGVIESRQLHRLTNRETGQLNEDGKRLVERVLRGRAVDEFDLLDAAPPAALEKLDRILPYVAQVQTVGGRWDITPALKGALRQIIKYRASGTETLETYFGQGSLLPDPEKGDPAVKSLALALDRMKPTEFAAAWSRYASMARAAGRGQAALPGAAPKSQPEAFDASFNRDGQPRRGAMFALGGHLTPEEVAGFARTADANGNLTQDKPLPESRRTLEAQLRAVLDPRSGKDTMLVTPGSPMPRGIPEDVLRLETPRGLVLTTNPEAVKSLEADSSIENMGRWVLGFDGGKPLAGNRSVRALDENGDVVGEVMTDRRGLRKAKAAMRRQSPVGKVDVVSPVRALEERQRLVDGEALTEAGAGGSDIAYGRRPPKDAGRAGRRAGADGGGASAEGRALGPQADALLPGGGRADAASVGVSGPERVARLVGAIQRDRAGQASPSLHWVPVRDTKQLITQRIAERFGREAVFFRNETPDIFTFDDVVLDPPSIFIDVEAENPYIVVLGHELIHAMKRDAPDIYGALKDALERELRDFPAYAGRMAEITDGESRAKGDDWLKEELFGDFLGEQMAEPAFWGRLARKDPGLFQHLAVTVRNLLDWLLRQFAPEGLARKHFADIEKARDAAADALAMYARRMAGEKAAGEPGAQSPRYALRDGFAPPFFSKMSHVLDAKLPGKGLGGQIKTVAERLAAKGEFKREELDWSGLLPWLESQKGAQVRKADVLAFLEANRIEVREVVKGGPQTPYPDANVGVVENAEGGWDLWDDDALVDSFWTQAEAEAARGRHLADEHGYRPEPDETRYSQYQLPGGESYRELLLTLPRAPGHISFEEFWKQTKIGDMADASPGTLDLARKEYEARGQNLPNPDVFRSSHWDEANVLAHVRFFERAGADGKRVLHIEEIQSDWHQEGRRKGYDDAPRGHRALLEWFDKRKEEAAARNDTAALAKIADQRTKYLMSGMRPNPGGVTDAPFKTTWPLLAMKRMIRWAAENNFDRVAWTPGVEQVKRYEDATRQAVDAIDWFSDMVPGSSFGERQRIVTISGVKNGAKVMRKEVSSREELSGLLGKAMADKIWNSPDRFGTLEGQDLTIGGEGMKGFYDRILPAELNRYLKQWGVKTGETSTVAEGGYRAVPADADGGAEVVRGSQSVGFHPTIEQARNEAARLNRENPDAAAVTLHSFDITPPMRESVLQDGQPLFALDENAGAAEKAAPDAVAAVRAEVERLREGAKGALPVEVHASQEELPAHLRPRPGQVALAVYDPDARRVHMVAGNLAAGQTSSAIVRAIAETYWRHEQVGHWGLEGLFRELHGEAWERPFGRFLDNVYRSAPRARLREVAAKYGFNLSSVEGQRLSAEEYFAAVAQDVREGARLDAPRRTVWRRFLDVVEAWLKKLGFMRLTPEDIHAVATDALRFVRRGAASKSSGHVPATALRPEPAFAMKPGMKADATVSMDKGVTARAGADRALMRSKQWLAAKDGDMDAARAIVRRLWTPARSEALRKIVAGFSDPVLVSAPSTSRANMLPLALGETLAAELGLEFRAGEEFWRALHDEQSKNIKPPERPFKPRLFHVKDAEGLRRALGGRDVVLIEDVLTTGQTAFQFAQAMEVAGVRVRSVAALMGDPRLSPEPQLVDKLQRALRNAGMPVKGKDLAGVLSRGEIIVILDRIQGAGPHEREELAKDLSGLLDGRSAGSIPRHSLWEGQGNPAGEGAGHGQAPGTVRAVSDPQAPRREAESGQGQLGKPRSPKHALADDALHDAKGGRPSPDEFTQSESGLSGLEMPELVHLARELMGAAPKIVKRLRSASRLGQFSALDGIALRADLFKGRRIGQVVTADPSTVEPHFVQKLSEEHGVPVDLIHVERSPAGRGRTALTAWRADIDEAARVLAHEIGHLIDFLPDGEMRRGNLLGHLATLKGYLKGFLDGVKDKEVRAEAKALSKWWHPWEEGRNQNFDKYRNSAKELYADALSVLLNAPGEFESRAPKFHGAFMEWLDRKPEARDAYQRIQDGLKSGQAFTDRVKRLREGFRRGDEAYRDFYDRPFRASPALRKLFVDEFSPLYSLLTEKRPRWLVERAVYSGSEKEAYVREIYHEVLKPLEAAGLTAEDLGEWLFHRRVAGERGRMANPQGFTAKASGERLEEMAVELGQERHEALEAAGKRFREIRAQWITAKMEASGMFSEDLTRTIVESGDYATFDVVDYIDKRLGAGGMGARIFRQVGTFKDVTNPLTATVMKDLTVIGSINWNTAKRAVAADLLKHRPREIEEADRKWNGKTHVPVEPSNPDKGLLVYMEGGKAKGWYVDSFAAEAFNRERPEALTYLGRLLGALATPYRMVFTQLRPGFQAFNLIRDFRRTVLNMPGANPEAALVKHYVKALRPAWKSVFGVPEATVKEMERGNMLISVADPAGLSREDEQLERVLSTWRVKPEEYKLNVLRPFSALFATALDLGGFLERIPKVAAYNYLKERFPELDADEIGHIVRGHAGSPAFLYRGEMHSVTNNIFLFSNAAKEGWRSDYEAMRADPKAWWWKWAKWSLAPKLVMWGMAAGLMGAGLKMILEGASEYDKTNYLIIPLGMTADGKSVYLRLPQEEFGRVSGGALWKLLHPEKRKTWPQLFDYLSGQAPTLNPAFEVAGRVIEYLSGRNPHDSFRGRDIIDKTAFEAGGWESHKQLLQWIWNASGGGIVHTFKGGDVETVKGELATILGMPVVSDTLGRFLKVTDQGVREELRDARDEVRQAQARETLAARMALAKMVNGEQLGPEEARALLDKMDYVKRQYGPLLAKKGGGTLEAELLAAKTDEEKIAVLKRWNEIGGVERTGEKNK